MRLTHGGDIRGFEEKYGRKPIDFSVNLSPLGMPESAARAAREALSEAEAYPDPLSRRLRKAVAEKEGVPESFVYIGNGAADIFYRVAYALRPREALIPAPSFTEYEKALLKCGALVHNFRCKDEEDFAVGRSFVDSFRHGIDAVFLCQPNNPTGLLTEKELLLELQLRCKVNSALLLIDECFLDLAEDGRKYSMVDQLEGQKNLAVVKSFTKLYAMAGLRLGYLLSSNEELIEAVYNAGQPWAVSNIAEAAGLAALKETEYEEKARSYVTAERERMFKELSALGLRVIPGRANFLLFKAPSGFREAHKFNSLY